MQTTFADGNLLSFTVDDTTHFSLKQEIHTRPKERIAIVIYSFIIYIINKIICDFVTDLTIFVISGFSSFYPYYLW